MKKVKINNESKQRINIKKTSIQIERKYNHPIYIITKHIIEHHILQLLEILDQNKIQYQIHQQITTIRPMLFKNLIVIDNKTDQLILDKQFCSCDIKIIGYPVNGKLKTVQYLKKPQQIVNYYTQYCKQKQMTNQNKQIKKVMIKNQKVSQQYQTSKIRILSITHKPLNKNNTKAFNRKCRLFIVKNNHEQYYNILCNTINKKLKLIDLVQNLEKLNQITLQEKLYRVYFLVYFKDVLNLMKKIKQGRLLICDFNKKSKHSQYFKQKRIEGIFFQQTVLNQTLQKLQINPHNLISNVVQEDDSFSIPEAINHQYIQIEQNKQNILEICVNPPLKTFKTGCFNYVQSDYQIVSNITYLPSKQQVKQNIKQQDTFNKIKTKSNIQTYKQINVQSSQSQIKNQKNKKIKTIKNNNSNSSQYFSHNEQMSILPTSSLKNYTNTKKDNHVKKGIINKHQKQSNQILKRHIKFKQTIVQSPEKVKRIKRVRSQTKSQPQSISSITQSVFTQTDSNFFQTKQPKKLKRIRSITCQSVSQKIQQFHQSYQSKIDIIVFRQFIDICQTSAKNLHQTIKCKNKLKSFINMDQYDRLTRTNLRKKIQQSNKEPIIFVVFINQQDYPSFLHYIQQKQQYFQRRQYQIQKSYTTPIFFTNVQIIPQIYIHLFINSMRIYCGITPKNKITLFSYFLPLSKFSPDKSIQIIKKNSEPLSFNKYYQ